MSTAFWAEWYGQPGDVLLYDDGAQSIPYPAVVPARRRYNLGNYAMTREDNLSGGAIKFLHSDYSHALGMTLEYQYLTQLEMRSIRDHYRSQDGTMVPFVLPDEIWAGHSSVTNLVPVGTCWRYQGPPVEDQLSGGLVNVSVPLRTADNWLPTPEPAAGLDLVVSALWLPGAATQVSTMNVTVTATWAPGAATAAGGGGDEAGFESYLYWSEDLYTIWR